MTIHAPLPEDMRALLRSCGVLHLFTDRQKKSGNDTEKAIDEKSGIDTEKAIDETEVSNEQFSKS